MRIIILAFAFIFYSCTVQCSDAVTEEYRQKLKEYPSFLIDFFPDTIANVYSLESDDDTTSLCISYKYFNYESKIVKPSDFLIKYTASNPDLITIKRETVTYWDRSKKIFYKSINKDSICYYPIPYFELDDKSMIGVKTEAVYSENTACGLSKDFEIYVLDSKPGNYWKGLKPLDYMPEGWKNGYSKGICINEESNIAIYWFVVW